MYSKKYFMYVLGISSMFTMSLWIPWNKCTNIIHNRYAMPSFEYGSVEKIQSKLSLNRNARQIEKNLIYYGSDDTLSAMFNNKDMMEKYSNHSNHSLLKRFPRCIGIGIAKSGTSVLVYFLNFHPQVVSHFGEPNFFNKNDYHKCYEKYLNRMPYSTKEQITFEKSPQYVTWNQKQVPERIYNFDPDIKLLVTVKNPTDGAISRYHHFKKYNTQPFEKLAFSSGEVQSTYKPVFQSMYYTLLQPWFKVFRREQIHVIDGDALIKNPVSELKKIENFLQLDSFYDEKQFYLDKEKGFYCFTDCNFSQCLPPRKGHHHTPLEPRLRSQLVNFYQLENEKLFKMIGQTFNWSE